MHPSLELLKTYQECEQFALLVQQRSPELAVLARRKAVELRAASHGAKTAIEREVLQAVYAYEEALSVKRGKRTRASRTWQMIARHGFLAAAERAVNRSQETEGYSVLVEIGLRDFLFEAVILRHPDAFSAEAVARSRERLGRGDGA